MSTVERRVWVLPERTKVTDEIIAAARQADTTEIVVGTPPALAKLVAAAGPVPPEGLLVVELVEQADPVAEEITLSPVEEQLADLRARVVRLEEAAAKGGG